MTSILQVDVAVDNAGESGRNNDDDWDLGRLARLGL